MGAGLLSCFPKLMTITLKVLQSYYFSPGFCSSFFFSFSHPKPVDLFSLWKVLLKEFCLFFIILPVLFPWIIASFLFNVCFGC